MKKIRKRALSVSLVILCLLSAAPTVSADGTAPIAENKELKTYRNVSVGGTLSAYDPDGDVVNYTITTEPIKGSISLEEDGRFVYTPRENKKGRDYFGYKAIDSEGKLSQEATVIIRIEKQKTAVHYEDMERRAEEFAAVELSETGLFTGEMLAGHYCFCPGKPVSRGEFLSMCMMLSGESIFTGVQTTSYTDDGSMSPRMRAVAMSALVGGVEDGYHTPSGSFFEADLPISRAEAAEILDRCLHLTPVRYPVADDRMTQACMDLTACGILRDSQLPETPLTRADAALMLTGAMQVVNDR